MYYKKCEICGIRSGRTDGNKRRFMAYFPINEDRCKQWVKVTGKKDLVYVPIEKLHQLKLVCGIHFTPKDFKRKKTQLRKTAVPSLELTAEPLPDKLLAKFPLHMAKNKKKKADFILSMEHNYCGSLVSESDTSSNESLPTTEKEQGQCSTAGSTMVEWRCCRFCLEVQALNKIFARPEHCDKYSDIIFDTTGVKVDINDSFSQLSCSRCIDFINRSYKFRKRCERAQIVLKERSQTGLYEVKIDPVILKPAHNSAIDINESNDDNITNENQIDDKTKAEGLPEAPVTTDVKVMETEDKVVETEDKVAETKVKVKKKRGRPKKEKAERKKKEKPKEVKVGERRKRERQKEEVECDYCHKVLTSRRSLRNHLKIHTGFDFVCEHCGKKFISSRRLLMHCKAKHGYEKTDKCSYCDYKGSNAEQVKLHERVHTGEKPYVCDECGARFHRRSSLLQHLTIHLKPKNVQCNECPARFKSVTLMRIHKNRHRARAQYTLARAQRRTFR